MHIEVVIAGTALRAHISRFLTKTAKEFTANFATLASRSRFSTTIRTLRHDWLLSEGYSLTFFIPKRARGKRFPITTRSVRSKDSIKRVVGIPTFVADRATVKAAHVTRDGSAFLAAEQTVHADPPAMRTIHFRGSFPRDFSSFFIPKRARGRFFPGTLRSIRYVMPPSR